MDKFMSKKNNIHYVTDKDIEKGIQEGVYQKEDISLVRDNEGKIVKHLKNIDTTNSIIPSTLVQINNNVIYQADIKGIIDAIIEIKNIKLFDDLEEKYQIVIDSLDYYKNHNDRLHTLNSNSLEISSIFEKRVEKYIKNIDINKIQTINKSELINMIDSYINILFVYLLSVYWLHNEKSSSDTIIKRKITKLEVQIRCIYEQLLANSTKEENGTNSIFMNNSMYAWYYLEDGDNGIGHIKKYIKHDSRFTSVDDFFGFINRFFLKKNSLYDNYNGTYTININLDKHDNYKDRSDLIEHLFGILEKIDALKNIISELRDAGQFNFDDTEANKGLHWNLLSLD